MLSETGYGSDFDGTTSTSGRHCFNSKIFLKNITARNVSLVYNHFNLRSSQSRQNLHLGESGRLQLTDGPLAKRILALKELKEQGKV